MCPEAKLHSVVEGISVEIIFCLGFVEVGW
jgi:hypothetical protein